MSSRTYKVTSPPMQGDDIRSWQQEIKHEFSRMSIACPIKIDGVWGTASRAFNASLCYALGMNAEKVMSAGITPELRTRIRNRRLTADEKARYESKERANWRSRLRKRYAAASIKVHRPVTTILQDSWGYHPGVHDAIDVGTKPNAVLFAMVKSKVIDVRSGGWWGKSPSGNVSLGDGIVQLEVLETVGPFKKGYHIGYGHCEHAKVSVGETVEAGDPIALAGLAVIWHIHLMINTGTTNRGIGNLDPRPFLDYAVDNG